MDENDWYPRSNPDYEQARPSSGAPLFRAASSVQDSHRLLAMYPMASATPSTHVARHLGNLSISAASPSFLQPDLYSLTYPQGNPPPYTEFAHELDYIPSQPLQYGESSGNHVVELLGHGTGPLYSRYPNSSVLSSQLSSYQTNPFAQFVLQRSVPASSYHTPPPGIMNTSSSLAFALGDPSRGKSMPHITTAVFGPHRRVESSQLYTKVLILLC
jgi:cohesin loading factor subunit SCC2